MKSFPNTLLAAILALALTAVVAFFVSLPLGNMLEEWMGDKMQTWRYELLAEMKSAPKPDAHLLLVAIDQRSVNDLGRWPFPRAVQEQFFDVLAPKNPKVVALDALFTEETTPSPTAV